MPPPPHFAFASSSFSSFSSFSSCWIDLAALTTSALFAGGAFYITFVEHPARMHGLCQEHGSPKEALLQWKYSYERAAPIQASLAGVTAVLGMLSSWLATGGRQGASSSSHDHHRAWLVGCLLTGINSPLTLLLIMPLNARLKLRAARALEQEEEGMGGDKAKADAAAAMEEAAEEEAEEEEKGPCRPVLAVKQGLPSTTALLRAWGWCHAVRTVLGCAGFGVLASEAVLGRRV
jgi:hypothetical protein